MTAVSSGRYLGGNPDLKPETAQVLTVGVVFEPQALKDVTATVDYYDHRRGPGDHHVTSDVILNSCYIGWAPSTAIASSAYADGYIVNINDPLIQRGR